MILDSNHPDYEELMNLFDEMDAFQKSAATAKKRQEPKPLTAQEVWASWDKQTKILCLYDIIAELNESIWELERRLIVLDICRAHLTPKRLEIAASDTAELKRKKASVETLKKKREEIMLEDSPGGSRHKRAIPSYLKLVYSKNNK